MAWVIIATASAAVVVLLASGFAIWYPFRGSGPDVFKSNAARSWVAACAVAGALVTFYVTFLIHQRDNDILAGRDFPEALEYLGVTALLVFFFVILVYGHLPPEDLRPNFLDRLRVDTLNREGARRAAFTIVAVTLVLTWPASTPTNWPDTAASYVKAVGANALIVFSLGAIFWAYEEVYSRTRSIVKKDCAESRREVASELVGLGAAHLQSELEMRLHDEVYEQYLPLLEETLQERDDAKRARNLANLYLRVFGTSSARRLIKEFKENVGKEPEAADSSASIERARPGILETEPQERAPEDD